MTAALSIFGIPPVITVIVVILVMFGIVLSGRYWTWEKITMAFCLVNLIYIPAAVARPPVGLRYNPITVSSPTSREGFTASSSSS